MTTIEETAFPEGTSDETDLLLRWLGFLQGAVVRKADGISDEDARWRPRGRLISLLGIVNHLTHVEWRWIDGCLYGRETSRSEDEFQPTDLRLATALSTYRERIDATHAAVRSLPLSTFCVREPDKDLRWVVLHLINETARHAGHADATRELLDDATGE